MSACPLDLAAALSLELKQDAEYIVRHMLGLIIAPLLFVAASLVLWTGLRLWARALRSVDGEVFLLLMGGLLAAFLVMLTVAAWQEWRARAR